MASALSPSVLVDVLDAALYPASHSAPEFFTQLDVITALFSISLFLAIGSLVVRRHRSASSFWFFRTAHTQSGKFIHPNSILLYAAFDILFLCLVIPMIQLTRGWIEVGGDLRGNIAWRTLVW